MQYKRFLKDIKISEINIVDIKDNIRGDTGK